MKPLLSIIIPVYNEKKVIEECVKSLYKQSYKNFEIIVVDDGSTDKTLDIVKRFKEIKILKQNHKGPGAARNLAAKQAKGKILILIDADMTFHKDYLKNLIQPIIEDKTEKVIGTEEELQVASNIKNIWSRCQGKLVSDPDYKNRKIFRAIRKDKFLELGGFDSKYGHADDQTFLFKHGIKPKIAKKAICYHKNPSSLKEVYKQSRWIGASTRDKWINIFLINLFMVFILFLLFPVAIIFLVIRKSYKNKDFKIMHYMLVFMTVKYFATLSGYLRRILWKKNVR